MPFPNEHSCRLREPAPKGSESGRVKRRSTDYNRDYWVIRQKYETGWAEQAFRYPKDTWPVDDARSHCTKHKGKRFEPAGSSTESRQATGRVLVCDCGWYHVTHAGRKSCPWCGQDIRVETRPRAAGRSKVGPLNHSPFWAIYRPALERLLSSAAARPSVLVDPAVRAADVDMTAATGAVARAKAAGVPVSQVGSIAILGVMGVLQKRSDWLLRMFGGTSYLGIKAAINAAVEDSGVDEILMIVDSPGGDVDGLSETADMIRAAREKKRITAYADGMIASAAYWLASQATEIIGERTSLVGSIGAITYLYDMSKAFAEAGIEPVVVSTGELKETGVPGTEVTEKQKAELQGIIDFYGDEFGNAIVQGRRMSPAAVKKLATGEIWPAPKALEHGLIDRTASFEDVVAALDASSRSRSTRRGHARAIRAWAHSHGL